MRNPKTELMIARGLLRRAHSLEWTGYLPQAMRLAITAQRTANDALMTLAGHPERLLWERDLRQLVYDANGLVDDCLAG